jgi:hypothetical protein
MKLLAIVIAAVVITVGVVGLVNPATLLAVGQSVITPVGLYVIAGVRIGIGVVLLVAASTSRMPRVLRLAGAVVVIAGIATPIFGVERSRAVLEWVTAQGPALMRGDGLLAMALGAFMIYAIGPLRRHAGAA